jgi:exopolyphosphatase/guanosine-5'-triphosphate,3'-diphosphate pyrophosphatase
VKYRAGIDIGTNSVRLLICAPDGQEKVREMCITRLGQGVDQTGELAPEAIDRTLAVLGQYAALLAEHRPYVLRMTATSAARDSRNRDVFFDAVTKLLGQAPELLPGNEEARLSFLGACTGLDTELGPFVIFDIGGGSTEFAFGSQRPERFISVNMGGVRVTERHLHTDPPTLEEIAKAETTIDALLDQVANVVQPQLGRTWLGLAGTVTSFAAHAAGLQTYDPSITHGFQLTRDHVNAFTEVLLATPTEQRRALLLEPKRAAVIVGGALVLRRIFQRFELQSIRVSERDILDGLILDPPPNEATR